MPKTLGLMLVFLAAGGCESLFSPELDDLLAAPEEVAIGGRKFTLETYLYRNLMPPVPPDGRPLIAIIWVTAEDHNPFPATLDADRIWVIRGQDVWEEKLSPGSSGDPGRQHQLEKVARDGPKWGPDIYVDVVVRVLEANGKDHLLRASHQYIGAAY